jgi:hypothetical protein
MTAYWSNLICKPDESASSPIWVAVKIMRPALCLAGVVLCTIDSQAHAYLLTPVVPEPSCIGPVGFALVLFRRRVAPILVASGSSKSKSL